MTKKITAAELIALGQQDVEISDNRDVVQRKNLQNKQPVKIGMFEGIKTAEQEKVGNFKAVLKRKVSIEQIEKKEMQRKEKPFWAKTERKIDITKIGKKEDVISSTNGAPTPEWAGKIKTGRHLNIKLSKPKTTSTTPTTPSWARKLNATKEYGVRKEKEKKEQKAAKRAEGPAWKAKLRDAKRFNDKNNNNSNYSDEEDNNNNNNNNNCSSSNSSDKDTTKSSTNPTPESNVEPKQQDSFKSDQEIQPVTEDHSATESIIAESVEIDTVASQPNTGPDHRHFSHTHLAAKNQCPTAKSILAESDKVEYSTCDSTNVKNKESGAAERRSRRKSRATRADREENASHQSHIRTEENSNTNLENSSQSINTASNVKDENTERSMRRTRRRSRQQQGDITQDGENKTSQLPTRTPQNVQEDRPVSRRSRRSRDETAVLSTLKDRTKSKQNQDKVVQEEKNKSTQLPSSQKFEERASLKSRTKDKVEGNEHPLPRIRTTVKAVEKEEDKLKQSQWPSKTTQYVEENERSASRRSRKSRDESTTELSARQERRRSRQQKDERITEEKDKTSQNTDDINHAPVECTFQESHTSKREVEGNDHPSARKTRKEVNDEPKKIETMKSTSCESRSRRRSRKTREDRAENASCQSRIKTEENTENTNPDSSQKSVNTANKDSNVKNENTVLSMRGAGREGGSKSNINKDSARSRRSRRLEREETNAIVPRKMEANTEEGSARSRKIGEPDNVVEEGENDVAARRKARREIQNKEPDKVAAKDASRTREVNVKTTVDETSRGLVLSKEPVNPVKENDIAARRKARRERQNKESVEIANKHDVSSVPASKRGDTKVNIEETSRPSGKSREPVEVEEEENYFAARRRARMARRLELEEAENKLNSIKKTDTS